MLTDPYLFDGNFNLSGYDGWIYGYDADNRLISAAGGGHSAQFVYDGLGRCVKRTIDGVSTVFTYDEWKPIVEWNVGGTFVAWNLYGPGADEILIRFQPDTNAGYIHYHLDAMGNVQFLLSEENLGLEKYTYDAFGRPTITSWTGDHRTISLYGNRFLFTGREYLYTLGIYDYRDRHYHPGLGRFIQTDPVGFGGDPLNLYRYCSGNPILHGDPTGFKVDWNNKLIWNCFTSDGFGDWVDGSDGMSFNDRHDHIRMGSNPAGSDAPQSIEAKTTPIPNPRIKTYVDVDWGGETEDSSRTSAQINTQYRAQRGATTTAEYSEPTEGPSINGMPHIIQTVTAIKHIGNDLSPSQYRDASAIEAKSVRCIQGSVSSVSMKLQNKAMNMSDANAVKSMMKEATPRLLYREAMPCITKADVMGGNAHP
jgi:RHS repeat-associated protein